MIPDDKSPHHPTRRQFIQHLAATGAAAAAAPPLLRNCLAADAPPTTQPPSRPNIILLVTDDQRADSLSCAGNPVLRTPHIDALAARGVRFRNAFTTTAICMSSRASIFTGLYTSCHGIDSFSKPLPRPLLDLSYPLLLRNAGYHTGFIGKWGLGGPLPKQDFDYFDAFPGQGFYWQPGQTKHLTTLQADSAVHFLHNAPADRPFCLSISFKAPHVQDQGRNQPGIYPKYPYDHAYDDLYKDAVIPPPLTKDVTPMPAFLDHTLNRTREAPDFAPDNYQETMKDLYRLLHGVDVAVGRIVDALRQTRRLDNTVILYTSDHGSFYGEHGFGGKWLMYEESIRTPMIVADPRLPTQLQGATRDEMVLNIDRAPTLLDLAGVPVPPHTQGRSLLPLIHGDHPAWRDEWFYEHPIHLKHNPIAVSQGIRTTGWKYLRYPEQTPVCEQLFDLAADPREETDLANHPDHQQTLAHLRDRCSTWRAHLKSWQPNHPWTDPA